MKNSQNVVRSQVNIQPVFRLVDFFEETTEYERNWQLPFNSLALCVRDDPEDPSWIELPEKNCRIYYEANVPYFTTCDTPMRIRYTPANRHFCDAQEYAEYFLRSCILRRERYRPETGAKGFP